MKHLLYFMAIVMMLIACGNQEATDGDVAPAQKKESTPQCVTIYRYGNFPKRTALALLKELQKTFPEVVLSDQVLDLPQDSYLKERNRYRASGLLKDLKKLRHGDAVIGLTDHIIYHPNEISPTFGVMGLSAVGSYTCVVSSRIPKGGSTHTGDNFVKLALHELGHAYGLSHCPDQHCYMVDAEHRMKFPQTHGFCKKCKAKLQGDGWNLK